MQGQGHQAINYNPAQFVQAVLGFDRHHSCSPEGPRFYGSGRRHCQAVRLSGSRFLLSVAPGRNTRLFSGGEP
jgi:hypothetical protein